MIGISIRLSCPGFLTGTCRASILNLLNWFPVLQAFHNRLNPYKGMDRLFPGEQDENEKAAEVIQQAWRHHRRHMLGKVSPELSQPHGTACLATGVLPPV